MNDKNPKTYSDKDNWLSQLINKFDNWIAPDNAASFTKGNSDLYDMYYDDLYERAQRHPQYNRELWSGDERPHPNNILKNVGINILTDQAANEQVGQHTGAYTRYTPNFFRKNKPDTNIYYRSTNPPFNYMFHENQHSLEFSNKYGPSFTKDDGSESGIDVLADAYQEAPYKERYAINGEYRANIMKKYRKSGKELDEIIRNMTPEELANYVNTNGYFKLKKGLDGWDLRKINAIKRALILIASNQKQNKNIAYAKIGQKLLKKNYNIYDTFKRN